MNGRHYYVAPTRRDAVVPDHTGLDATFLLEWFQAPVAFHRPLIDLTSGSVSAALMLTYAMHWTREFHFAAECHPDLAAQGFMLVTQAEWERETGLTRSEQETARRKLRELGYLEEQRHGLPAKLYYRVHMQKVINDLRSQAEHRLQEAQKQP